MLVGLLLAAVSAFLSKKFVHGLFDPNLRDGLESQQVGAVVVLVVCPYFVGRLAGWIMSRRLRVLSKVLGSPPLDGEFRRIDEHKSAWVRVVRADGADLMGLASRDDAFGPRRRPAAAAGIHLREHWTFDGEGAVRHGGGIHIDRGSIVGLSSTRKIGDEVPSEFGADLRVEKLTGGRNWHSPEQQDEEP